MSQEAQTRLVMRDFAGFITNVDPLDMPPGAGLVQVNLLSREEGEMLVRRGLAPLRFENDGRVPGT
jgi:hypothetical protein